MVVKPNQSTHNHFYFSKTKCNPAKKITGQCFSAEMKAICKNSANLVQKKTTKIVTYPLLWLASSYNTINQSKLKQNAMMEHTGKCVQAHHNWFWFYFWFNFSGVRILSQSCSTAYAIIANIHVYFFYLQVKTNFWLQNHKNIVLRGISGTNIIYGSSMNVHCKYETHMQILFIEFPFQIEKTDPKLNYSYALFL